MQNITLFERFGDQMPPGYGITEEQRAENIQIDNNLVTLALSRCIEYREDDTLNIE